jgi:hypothetical protein
MFCYFDGFPDDVGMVGHDIGYDLGFVEVDTAFYASGISLVLPSGVSYVFRDLGW